MSRRTGPIDPRVKLSTGAQHKVGDHIARRMAVIARINYNERNLIGGYLGRVTPRARTPGALGQSRLEAWDTRGSSSVATKSPNAATGDVPGAHAAIANAVRAGLHRIASQERRASTSPLGFLGAPRIKVGPRGERALLKRTLRGAGHGDGSVGGVYGDHGGWPAKPKNWVSGHTNPNTTLLLSTYESPLRRLLVGGGHHHGHKVYRGKRKFADEVVRRLRGGAMSEEEARSALYRHAGRFIEATLDEATDPGPIYTRQQEAAQGATESPGGPPDLASNENTQSSSDAGQAGAGFFGDLAKKGISAVKDKAVAAANNPKYQAIALDIAKDLGKQAVAKLQGRGFFGDLAKKGVDAVKTKIVEAAKNPVYQAIAKDVAMDLGKKVVSRVTGKGLSNVTARGQQVGHGLSMGAGFKHKRAVSPYHKAIGEAMRKGASIQQAHAYARSRK